MADDESGVDNVCCNIGGKGFGNEFEAILHNSPR